ncbi:hypothetical protein [Brucella sp. NBRC 12950]|uniref:hypothetical protein n=1 Tax=Brucella sp. NBRC 12950 TaxID=2994518 RepID=UPI0024A29D7F|nr:hypothetical protein [Brucella sp. NBRC 12950]GLU28012.1 hypothetical protein Brsp01_32450 [Brucella sp. NBRC 12950]
MHTAVDRAFPPWQAVARCQQDKAEEGDDFTTMYSVDAISITGMKRAIISKTAALWKFVSVGYGVGGGLPAVQPATAAFRHHFRR